MKTLFAAVALVTAAAAVHFVNAGPGEPAPAAASATAAPVPPATSGRLVVHEWGTFTSFAGSAGVPVSFHPNNDDLPGFIYVPENGVSKGGRLARGGTVSMETPVVYFYTDRETRAAVTVRFPKGWITEWYPFATRPPGGTGRQPAPAADDAGQSIRWDVTLQPGGPARFPTDNRNPDRDSENPYYHARETNAVPLAAEVDLPANSRPEVLRGGTIVQRERFLFYRGVGTFPPPVTVRALGGGQVRVTNAAGGRVSGLVLVHVHRGKVGFRVLDDLDAGADAVATVPDAVGDTVGLDGAVTKSLIGAGLYEAEAKAMVKTWDAAWFGEEGTRLLYLVPRPRTDELLPLTVEPKPAEVVRVLVGRHDFLTPEREATADRLEKRARAARAELDAAEKELSAIGRFAPQARQLAGQRLDAATTPGN